MGNNVPYLQRVGAGPRQGRCKIVAVSKGRRKRQIRSPFHSPGHKKEGEEYRGYEFTGEDIHNLNTTGNLGHIPNLTVDYSTGETESCYISKYSVTHEIFHLTKEYANLIHQVRDYRLTQSEFADYEAGKEVGPITFTSSNGEAVTTSIQMSALKRGGGISFRTQYQIVAAAERRAGRRTEKPSVPIRRSA